MEDSNLRAVADLQFSRLLVSTSHPIFVVGEAGFEPASTGSKGLRPTVRRFSIDEGLQAPRV